MADDFGTAQHSSDTHAGVMATTCYACDQPATTREHVPPLSFFPVGHRTNLITVPSCELHNNANAMDVEYTRLVITVFHGGNEVGDQHFQNMGMRTLQHTPALLHTAFGDIRPVRIEGVETGAFTMDTDRVRIVMSACLAALHFRETGEKIPAWSIVFPMLGFPPDATAEEVGLWREQLHLFTHIPFVVRETNSPKVFQYAVGEIEGGRVYAMKFYSGFLVFGYRAPTDEELAAIQANV